MSLWRAFFGLFPVLIVLLVANLLFIGYIAAEIHDQARQDPVMACSTTHEVQAVYVLSENMSYYCDGELRLFSIMD